MQEGRLVHAVCPCEARFAHGGIIGCRVGAVGEDVVVLSARLAGGAHPIYPVGTFGGLVVTARARG